MHFNSTEDLVKFLRQEAVEPKKLEEPKVEVKEEEEKDDGEVLQAD